MFVFSLRYLSAGVACSSALALLTPSASAQPVVLEFDSEAELLNAGFEHIQGGSSTFEGGTLRTQTDSYEEWSLNTNSGADSKWWTAVHPDKGWWVEATLTVLSGDAGFWIHDGVQMVKFSVTPTQIGLTYPTAQMTDYSATSEPATYRFELARSGELAMLVDGSVVDSVTLPTTGAGTETLMFGHLGTADPSEVVWESFAYDTAEAGSEDLDDDGDGVTLDWDNCPGVPNLEQLDEDGDRIGDDCDTCPSDPLNDQDGDELCADEDPCPTDPENIDSDGDGVCDVDEFGDCPLGPYPEDECFGVDPVPIDDGIIDEDPSEEDDTGSSGDLGNSDDGGATSSDSGGCSLSAGQRPAGGWTWLLTLLFTGALLRRWARV